MKSNIQLVPLSTIAALSAILVSTGCRQEESRTADANTSKSYLPAITNRMAMPTRTNRLDNTRINVRDRAESTLTTGDLGETEADRDITQQIRTGLTSDDKLSATAKNVKIITRNRNVTLRGAVGSEDEKTTITTMAKNVAGEGHVTDELEVTKP